MRKRSPMSLDQRRGYAPERFFSFVLRNLPPQFTNGTDRGRSFPITTCLGIAAVCLAAVFVGFITLEAFDGDPDLWPFGGEHGTVTADASSPVAVQPLQGRVALTAILCVVMTAGAHLVAQHRARSALAADSALLFTLLDMAEPRESTSAALPVLGHFFYRGPGDDRNVSGRTNRTFLGLLPSAMGLASRFSS